MTPPTPSWWPKLLRLAEEHGLDANAAVAHAEILHDDGCSRLKGAGVCDCDPDVRLVAEGGLG